MDEKILIVGCDKNIPAHQKAIQLAYQMHLPICILGNEKMKLSEIIEKNKIDNEYFELFKYKTIKPIKKSRSQRRKEERKLKKNR